MTGYFENFLKVCADNLYTIITGKYKQGEADLNDLGNLALLRLDRKTFSPDEMAKAKLTKEQSRAAKRFYEPFVMFMSDRYHRIYTEKTGKFSPRYLPQDIYGMWIDRFYSDRAEAKYLDNKCYYYKFFSGIKQPEAVVMRVGKTWLGADFSPISKEKALALVKNESEAVLKKAQGSEGGYGVRFISGENIEGEFLKALDEIKGDIVVQRPIKQHEKLAALHPRSVNTFRVVSLLTEDKVKVYAVAIKIGTGGSRADNAGQNGLYCGVRPDGSLGSYAVYADGTKITSHPDLGYKFSDMSLPFVKKAAALVKKAHGCMGHFRLISWDIAVDENGEAVLVEANLSLGGITLVQMCTGPLFGKDTEKILKEVTNGKRKVTVLL